MVDEVALALKLKRLIVESLHLEGLTPESIADDTPLFGQGLGLDSVDALELVVALEKEFQVQIQIDEIDKGVFASVAHLAEFVARMLDKDSRGTGPDGQESQVA